MAALGKLIREASQKLFTPGPDVAADEHTIPLKKPTEEVALAAQKAGDPIPHHYIKRKPHPNCVVIWGLATKSSKTGNLI